MQFRTSVQHDITVMAVSGELNVDGVAKLHDAVAEALQTGQRDFVIDLKELTGIDSAGLEAFTALQRQCDEQLGMVKFCGADATVMKIFEMTRLDKVFALHRDVEDALASFEAGAALAEGSHR